MSGGGRRSPRHSKSAFPSRWNLRHLTPQLVAGPCSGGRQVDGGVGWLVFANRCRFFESALRDDRDYLPSAPRPPVPGYHSNPSKHAAQPDSHPLCCDQLDTL
jgi:hypothetical protein